MLCDRKALLLLPCHRLDSLGKQADFQMAVGLQGVIRENPWDQYLWGGGSEGCRIEKRRKLSYNGVSSETLASLRGSSEDGIF